MSTNASKSPLNMHLGDTNAYTTLSMALIAFQIALPFLIWKSRSSDSMYDIALIGSIILAAIVAFLVFYRPS